MIYLASPYSSALQTVRHNRYIQARDYTARQLFLGEVIFSPIVYGHIFAEAHALPTDARSWWQFNQAMMVRAVEIRVLQLPGWSESRGVAMEISFASENGIPITYENL